MTAYLKEKYNVSLEGKINQYLSISVRTGDRPWKLDQTHEIEEFLTKNGMDVANPTN
jgi:hypothetical protein